MIIIIIVISNTNSNNTNNTNNNNKLERAWRVRPNKIWHDMCVDVVLCMLMCVLFVIAV